MNFQQLRSVREAVRQGFNLTAVAASLHTSQPGVSRQIRELEDELGISIFVRAGKRLTGLTPRHYEAQPKLLTVGSLLQMARAYTTFARDGEVIPITMLRQEQPVSGIRVLSPETAREIRTMLQMAAGPGGTGTLAQTIGYSVGGKSGTAHKQEGKGYATNKYRSWFVGMAPIDKPRIVVAVMVDEPGKGVYFGGDVAAPVFSQVVQQTLRLMNVAPDLEVAPQIMAAKAAPAERESF
mgnify:CR=1 FL=1